MEGCLMKWLFFRLNVDHLTNLKQPVVDRLICSPNWVVWWYGIFYFNIIILFLTGIIIPNLAQFC